MRTLDRFSQSLRGRIVVTIVLLPLASLGLVLTAGEAAASVVPFGITKDMTIEHINREILGNRLLEPIPVGSGVVKIFGPKDRRAFGIFDEFLIATAVDGSLCTFGAVKTFPDWTASGRGYDAVKAKLEALLGEPDTAQLDSAAWKAPESAAGLSIKKTEVYVVFIFKNSRCE